MTVGFNDAALVAALPALRRLAHHYGDTEDLVQDTCERALRKRELFKGGDLQAWLIVMLRHVRIDRIRTERCRRDYCALLPDRVLPPPQESVVAIRELGRLIERMPDVGAEMLIPVAHGFSYPELAQQRGIPLGTVMSRVHRARASLAVELA